MAVPHDVSILYIGGEGRSGSTLLSSLLGQKEGLFPVGELRGVWRAVTTNELCGCGVPFDECDFWTRVGIQAFGGWSRVDVQTMLAWDASYARHRSVPRLLAPRVQRTHAAQVAKYVATLSTLYDAVQTVSKAEIIVDSTKDPPYAFLLRQLPRTKLRVVHLVRDSRGVAFSWARSVPRPEYDNHPSLHGTTMDRRSPVKAALFWDLKNLLFHVLGRFGVPRLLVRYEDLVANPSVELERVTAFALGRGVDKQPANAHATRRVGQTYVANAHHSLGGNRIRFRRGQITVKADDAWHHDMKWGARWVVLSLTLPLLVRYRYFGRRAA